MSTTVPEPQPPQPTRKHRARWFVLAGALLLAVLAGGILFLASARFQEMVRVRLVAALEQATGGRVELQSFSVQWSRLEVTLRGLVIHGREGPAEPPLFSADWLDARWHLLSVWTLKADLSQLRVMRPKIYVVVDDEGKTNVPTPQRTAPPRGKWAEQLIDLRITMLEVSRGEFRWNQSRVPLDFHAEQFQARLDYEPQSDRYAGRLDYRDAVLTSADARRLPSSGEVRFALYRDHAELESVSLEAGNSRLAAQGAIRNFQSPQLDLHYDLQADWQDATVLLRASGWEGDIRSSGEAKADSSGWNLEGDLQVQTRRNGIREWSDVPWSARGLLRVHRPSPDNAATLSPSAEGTPPPWQVSLQNLEVSTLGGRLTGSALVQPSAAGPSTTLELAAERLSFPALLTALGHALSVPLERLQWAGALSGPVQVRFAGAGKGLTLNADCNVEPALVVPPGFAPVSGRLQGSYDAAEKRVESRDSYVDLPRTHLAGTGWFREQESQMQLAAETSNLEETRALAELLWKESTTAPLHLYGHARAAMGWTGGTRRPRLQGNFRAEDFSYQEVRWDSFSGLLDYQHDFLPLPTADGPGGTEAPPDLRSGVAQLAIRSGQLRKGGAGLDFDGSMILHNGRFEPQSAFSIAARVHDAALADVQGVAKTQYPIDGRLEGSFTASGTRQNPRGQGSVSLAEGRIYDEPYDLLTADLHFAPGAALTADPIRLHKSGATLQGRLTLQLHGEQFEFELAGSDFPVESLQMLRSDRLELAGLAQVKLSAHGTLNNPQVAGQVDISELHWGKEHTGRVSMGVESRDRKALWTIGAELLGGNLRGSGETALQDPYASSGKFDFAGFDLPLLLGVFRQPPEELEGKVTGTVEASGTGRNLRAATLRGEVTSLEASYSGSEFHSTDPIPFRYQNELLSLDGVHLVGQDVDLQTSGTIRLAADPALNLDTRGHIELAALSRRNPDLATSGQVQLDAQLNGTVRHPLWRGNINVFDVSLQYGNLPNGFDHVNGTIVFDGSTGVLQDFRAESGGGQIRIDGFVQAASEAGWQVNLSGTVTSVRVRYPEGLSTWVDGQVSWSGTVQSSRLEGRLTITRQNTSPSFDLARAFLSRREESTAAAMPAVLRNTRLNLELLSAPDIRLDTLTARNVQTDIEMHIQGTLERPVWLGRIGILQGEIEFAGKNYAVNRGEITFLNPFQTAPELNLSVQSRVQKYDIAMDFTGPPERLTVTYRSDPPLPTRDILALLVAGNSRETSLEASATQPVPQVGADALLTQALRSQITSRLDRLFGVGRFRVDPQISGLGRSTNASIALEQRFTDDLSLTYITDVTSSQQQLIQGEWTISPKLSVVGIRDQNGLIGVNFQVTLRFR